MPFNISMKDPRLSVRADANLKKRLKEAAETTGINESVLVIRCVEALLDHIEKSGSITFPLAISPKPNSKYPPHKRNSYTGADDGATTVAGRPELNDRPNSTPVLSDKLQALADELGEDALVDAIEAARKSPLRGKRIRKPGIPAPGQKDSPPPK